jgi:hypothetical protein
MARDLARWKFWPLVLRDSGQFDDPERPQRFVKVGPLLQVSTHRVLRLTSGRARRDGEPRVRVPRGAAGRRGRGRRVPVCASRGGRRRHRCASRRRRRAPACPICAPTARPAGRRAPGVARRRCSGRLRRVRSDLPYHLPLTRSTCRSGKAPSPSLSRACSPRTRACRRRGEPRSFRRVVRRGREGPASGLSDGGRRWGESTFSRLFFYRS